MWLGPVPGEWDAAGRVPTPVRSAGRVEDGLTDNPWLAAADVGTMARIHGRISDRRLDPARSTPTVPRTGDVPQSRRATRVFRFRQHSRATRPQQDDDRNGKIAWRPRGD